MAHPVDPAELLARIEHRLAIHEAAHAVIACEVGWSVVFIDMRKVDDRFPVS
jgi:hypothetical protein